ERMSQPATHPREAILQSCAVATPHPWYPAGQAEAFGLERRQLDAVLDELRLGGLIALTDWIQGKGQGYTLTPQGRDVLQNPRQLQRLCEHGVDPVPPPALPPAAAPDAATAWDRGETVREALLHPRPARVTMVLFAINVAVFMVGLGMAWFNDDKVEEILKGSNTEATRKILRDTGAASRQAIDPDQEWWRLLSACFVHIGLIHLIVNMI